MNAEIFLFFFIKKKKKKKNTDIKADKVTVTELNYKILINVYVHVNITTNNIFQKHTQKDLRNL